MTFRGPPIVTEDTSFDLNSAITIDECRLRNQRSAVCKVSFALDELILDAQGLCFVEIPVER